ncbi:MAG: PRC-barrel domain-containing protein [Pseudomonadota bacterium]
MKKLLITTALAAALTTPALAGNQGGEAFLKADGADLRSSEFVGMRVYAADVDLGKATTFKPDGEIDWDDIGEISDLVVSRDGELKSILVDVGGFLGIGEKTIAVSMDELHFKSEDGSDDVFIVMSGTRADLEGAVEYDLASIDGEEKRAKPAFEQDGYQPVPVASVTDDKLIGMWVYTSLEDYSVGEVSQVLKTADGTPERVIVDFGGFLGVGERQIAVDIDEVKLFQQSNDEDYKVLLEKSRTEIENMPTYEG